MGTIDDPIQYASSVEQTRKHAQPKPEKAMDFGQQRHSIRAVSEVALQTSPAREPSNKVLVDGNGGVEPTLKRRGQEVSVRARRDNGDQGGRQIGSHSRWPQRMSRSLPPIAAPVKPTTSAATRASVPSMPRATSVAAAVKW